jgi:hypothetical protein
MLVAMQGEISYRGIVEGEYIGIAYTFASYF